LLQRNLPKLSRHPQQCHLGYCDQNRCVKSQLPDSVLMGSAFKIRGCKFLNLWKAGTSYHSLYHPLKDTSSEVGLEPTAAVFSVDGKFSIGVP